MPIDYTLSSAAKSISLSYDGKLLACSSSSVPTTVTVFNVSDGVMVAKLTAAPGHVFGQVAFLPDQSLVIVANRKDGVPNEIVQVKLDDTIVHRIPISESYIRYMAVSPKAAWISTASYDGSIHLVRMGTGK